MKNKMTELKIAYFDQLGRKELDQAVQHFVLKHPNVDVKLLATSHDGAFAKLNEDEADIAINDLRDENLNFDETELTQAGVMAILPKGMYPNGIQMIEKDELNDMTCFIVAKPEEEVNELHLFKGLYQIGSQFIASNSVEEAALLVASGSGYFILNENTARLINTADLQPLFLFDHGQLIKQEIKAFYKSNSELNSEFVKLLQQEY